MSEDVKTQRLNVRMPEDLHRKALETAERRGENLSDAVRSLIAGYVRDNAPTQKTRLGSAEIPIDQQAPTLSTAVTSQPNVRGASDALLRQLGDKRPAERQTNDDDDSAFWGDPDE